MLFSQIGVNLYGVRSVEFTFLGNYYLIYSVLWSLIFNLKSSKLWATTFSLLRFRNSHVFFVWTEIWSACLNEPVVQAASEGEKENYETAHVSSYTFQMGSSFATVFVEVLTLLFYIGMLFKFNDFRVRRFASILLHDVAVICSKIVKKGIQLQKISKSGAADVKRMTRGVLRTTLAACCISVGEIF